ncbi:MAG: hypothetical protein JSW68_02765 [Burkholderiales bacterium]|nr:MAG: hypothetical protein JSW68_02765 [Burkholderiales bacterium]
MSYRSMIARIFVACLTLVGSSAALAHHGWAWTGDGAFKVTGTIERVTLGNPHGVLILDVDGEKWTAEVGQPWRHQRAGLPDEKLIKGVTLTVVGKRSADPKERRVKAERVVIDGRNYDLYPGRLAD